MKNKLIDLNDHLFAQLERLGDDHISPENLKKEVERSKAITAVSNQVVSNARLALEAAKYRSGGMPLNQKLPEMLEFKK